MAKFLYSLGFLLSLFFVLPSMAGQKANELLAAQSACGLAIRAINESNAPILNDYATLDGMRLGEPSVELIGSKQTPQGHTLHVYRRIEDLNWLAFGVDFFLAPQGDLRWPKQFFGKAWAELMGFQSLSDRTCTAPSAAALNYGLDRLDSELTAANKTAFRYYDLPLGHAYASYREYLSKVVFQKLLPIGGTEISRVHDVTFHSGAIVLPEEIFARLSVVYGELVRLRKFFWDYLLSKNASLVEENKEEVEFFAENIFFPLIIQIDGATGLTTSTLATLRNVNSAPENRSVGEGKAFLREIFLTPVVNLTGRIDKSSVVPEIALNAIGTELKHLDESAEFGSIAQFLYMGFMGMFSYEEGFKAAAQQASQGNPLPGPIEVPGVERFRKAREVIKQILPGVYENPALARNILLDYLKSRADTGIDFFGAPTLTVEEFCTRTAERFLAMRKAASKINSQN